MLAIIQTEFSDQFVGAAHKLALETRSGTFAATSPWTQVLPCANRAKSSSFNVHLAFFHYANTQQRNSNCEGVRQMRVGVKNDCNAEDQKCRGAEKKEIHSILETRDLKFTSLECIYFFFNQLKQTNLSLVFKILSSLVYLLRNINLSIIFLNIKIHCLCHQQINSIVRCQMFAS